MAMGRLRRWYSHHHVVGTPESSAFSFVASIGFALFSAIVVEGVLFYWMPAQIGPLGRLWSTFIRFAVAIVIAVAVLALLYWQACQFFRKQHHPPEHVVTTNSPSPESFPVLVTLATKPPKGHPYKLQFCPMHWYTQPGLELVKQGAGKDNIVIFATESLLEEVGNRGGQPVGDAEEECKFVQQFQSYKVDESKQENAKSALRKAFAWHLACADKGDQSLQRSGNVDGAEKHDTGCPICSEPSSGQPAKELEGWLEKVTVQSVDDLGSPSAGLKISTDRNELEIHMDDYSEKCTQALKDLVRNGRYAPSQVLVDVTGAKKLHSLGLFLAARNIGACVAYVDAYADKSLNIYIFHETSVMEQTVYKLVSDLRTLEMFKGQLHESKGAASERDGDLCRLLSKELDEVTKLMNEGRTERNW